MTKPLAQSDKMLLTAGSRVSNTGLKWNDTRTRVQNQGGPPSLIEPVAGTVMLRNLEKAMAISVAALDGAGKPAVTPYRRRKRLTDGRSRSGTQPPPGTWFPSAVNKGNLCV